MDARRNGMPRVGPDGLCYTCYQHRREYGTLEGFDPDTRPGRVPAFEERPWVERALCAQVDGDLFYPDKGSSSRAAKAVCARCPVRQECLEWALRTREPFGVLGGMTEAERRWLLRGAA